MMDIPPPTCKKAYANSNESVLAASKKAIKEERFAASADLHALAAAGILVVPPPLVEDDSDSESDEEEDEGDCDPDDCEGTSDLSDDEDTQSRHPGGVESIDVTVTYDGTWSKRGFTAQYGVGVVAAWDTGRVLDTKVMSGLVLNIELNSTLMSFIDGMKRTRPAVNRIILGRLRQWKLQRQLSCGSGQRHA